VPGGDAQSRSEGVYHAAAPGGGASFGYHGLGTAAAASTVSCAPSRSSGNVPALSGGFNVAAALDGVSSFGYHRLGVAPPMVSGGPVFPPPPWTNAPFQVTVSHPPWPTTPPCPTPFVIPGSEFASCAQFGAQLHPTAIYGPKMQHPHLFAMSNTYKASDLHSGSIISFLLVAAYVFIQLGLIPPLPLQLSSPADLSKTCSVVF